MLTKNEAISIARQFIQDLLPQERWFQHVQPFVQAMLLYGSVAKGQNRPDSDIDLLIILPLEIEENFTSGEYVYHFHNHEINIVLRSIERMRAIAKEANDSFQKEVFRGCVPITVSEEVSALLASIANIPELPAQPNN